MVKYFLVDKFFVVLIFLYICKKTAVCLKLYESVNMLSVHVYHIASWPDSQLTESIFNQLCLFAEVLLLRRTLPFLP